MTSREGSDMQKPDWLTSNINLGNVLTLVAMLAGGSYAYGSLNNRMETMEAYRTERVRQTDEKFSAITRALEGLPNLSYRVTAQEEALKATNQRVDVSLANISQRLAEINQALGALDTKVAVLTQRLESSTPQRRASIPAVDPPG